LAAAVISRNGLVMPCARIWDVIRPMLIAMIEV
jgi:hypothetical protein